MTHLLRTNLLRTAVALSLLTTVSSVPAMDEDNAAGDAGSLPLVGTTTEAKTVYTVPTLKVLWEAQAIINTARDKVSHIALDEEVVFLQSSAGIVTAINAESGRQFWSAQVGQNDEVAMKATTDSQMVAIVVGPVIHAFDKFSGQKLFSFRLPNLASASPLITRREVTTGSRVDVTRSIFVPLGDQSIVAYDAKTLQYIGSHGALKPGVSRALDWRFAGGEMIRFAPVAGEERLAFATEVGNIHVVDMTGSDKGKSRFQFLMNSRSTAPLVVATRDDNEYLLAACDNNRLFCIALKTDGSMLWTVPMGSAVTQPITVVGNDVFVVSSDTEIAKFDLTTGRPSMVSQGAVAVASQTEGGSGQSPAYGASVQVSCQGLLGIQPFNVSNNSTGQMVNSVAIEFPLSMQQLAFVADEVNMPIVRVSESQRKATGLKALKLSEDRRTLTMEFSDFNPGEKFEFNADIQHPEIPAWKLTHKSLIGAKVKASVSPVRASVVASSATRVEPFPPRNVIGRFADVSRPWKVTGAKSLVAISENAVYFVDLNDRVVSASRDFAGIAVVTPTREYTIPINNGLTDRVYLSTESGRVACFTESRIELGTMPIPALGGVTWVLYPMTELSPDFAVYHQDPNRRPIMPDVPKKDPAIPAQDSDATEMP